MDLLFMIVGIVGYIYFEQCKKERKICREEATLWGQFKEFMFWAIFGFITLCTYVPESIGYLHYILTYPFY